MAKIKHQFVGSFSSNHEARTICDELNQNGDGMYVEGSCIYCDNDIDIVQVRQAMGQLHENYYLTHCKENKDD